MLPSSYSGLGTPNLEQKVPNLCKEEGGSTREGVEPGLSERRVSGIVKERRRGVGWVGWPESQVGESG